jgi:endo-1,4-beta-xylanase
LWQIVSNGDGFYHIVNKNSGQAIGLAGVNGGSNDSWGSDLIQWTYGDYEDQNWCLEVTEGGYYKLCSRNSDQVVGIANPNNQSGSVAITWPDVFGAQDQEFSFVPVSQ